MSSWKEYQFWTSSLCSRSIQTSKQNPFRSCVITLFSGTSNSKLSIWGRLAANLSGTCTSLEGISAKRFLKMGWCTAQEAFQNLRTGSTVGYRNKQNSSRRGCGLPFWVGWKAQEKATLQKIRSVQLSVRLWMVAPSTTKQQSRWKDWSVRYHHCWKMDWRKDSISNISRSATSVQLHSKTENSIAHVSYHVRIHIT